MYFLNYVDRNAIAQARLNNLEDDLGMTGTEFNTTVSMYAGDPSPDQTQMSANSDAPAVSSSATS